MMPSESSASTTTTAAGPLAAHTAGMQTRPEKSHVRWTICAMLFCATSINYMDRQVLGILAAHCSTISAGPRRSTVTSSAPSSSPMRWGWCWWGGWWTGWAARLGYVRGDGDVEPGGDGPCAGAAPPSASASRASFSGWARAATFPRRSRRRQSGFRSASGRWRRASSTRERMWARSWRRSIIPWITLRFGWHVAFLTTGGFSAAWIVWWWFRYRSPEDHPTVSAAELALITSDRAPEGGDTAVAQPAGLSADVGVFTGEIPHRSDLVLLSLLAAEVSRRTISSGADASRSAADPGV